MLIPIPNYFALTANNDEIFANKTVYSKSCSCNIINTTHITDRENKELYEITKERDSYDQYCIPFNPKETKEFIIHFEDPILESESIVGLIGFNMYWKDPNYLYRKDKAIIIDTKRQMILGTKNL